MNSHQTGGSVEYTLVVVPLITLILWCLSRHDSIAVSESLLLLPAVELEATELALARTCLSLFPKTSFTATETGACLHISVAGTRAVQQVQRGEHHGKENHGTEILTWCNFKAFPFALSREPKLTRPNNHPYVLPKLQILLLLPQSTSRGFPVPKYCEMDEFCKAEH